MTNEDLVTIASYGNPQEASMAQGALESENIRSFLMGAETASTLSYVGSALGGVKLQVARGDSERASGVLAAIAAPEDAPSGSAWMCPDCSAEVDAGFDVCWSCGRVADEELVSTDPDQTADKTDERTTDPTVEDSQQPHNYLASSADATRAWRAAVLGIGFFPCLIYSFYLIVNLSSEELTPSATRKYYGALAIILLMSVAFWNLFRVVA